MSPATQCFAPQAATATVDSTLKANKLTSANANNDFMNKAPFRQANRTRQLLSCTGRGRWPPNDYLSVFQTPALLPRFLFFAAGTNPFTNVAGLERA